MNAILATGLLGTPSDSLFLGITVGILIMIASGIARGFRSPVPRLLWRIIKAAFGNASRASEHSNRPYLLAVFKPLCSAVRSFGVEQLHRSSLRTRADGVAFVSCAASVKVGSLLRSNVAAIEGEEGLEAMVLEELSRASDGGNSSHSGNRGREARLRMDLGLLRVLKHVCTLYVRYCTLRGRLALHDLTDDLILQLARLDTSSEQPDAAGDKQHTSRPEPC